MKREFNIFRQSEDYDSLLKRRLCVDTDPRYSKEIRDFIYSNLDDFLIVAERVLTFQRMYYDKYNQEYRHTSGNQVSAFKFIEIKNTRIYCQEMCYSDGQFFIICARLFEKKSQKNNKKNLPLLVTISKYEYEYKP